MADIDPYAVEGGGGWNVGLSQAQIMLQCSLKQLEILQWC
jgi:hypothetical protein